MNSKDFATYIAVGCLVIVLGLIFLPMQAQAAPAALPPRPTPVTPTVMPTIPVPAVSSGGGASIQLRVKAASNLAVWTELQWQDGVGGWHMVEGWRGQLDSISNSVGLKTWWVAPADLGKGPFRWQVFQSVGGKRLATSAPFNLPAVNRTLVAVDVALAP
jgi:hypothetical protein